MEILRPHLEKECDPRLPGELAYSVKEAYRFLWELINTTPILQAPEMKKAHGYLRQGLVDVALRLVLENSQIETKIQLLPARNNSKNGYTYTMIEAKGAIISPVKTSSIKTMPRKALYRSVESVKNKQFDLFTTEEDINQYYDDKTPPFLLLTYGGNNHHLSYIQLGLPDVETEQWIDKINIFNAPRIITSKEQEQTTQKKLELSLTEYAQEQLRRDDINGTQNI